MLTLVNQDRQANGLTSVAWDEAATAAGLAHAEEMAQFGYLSHWNLEGQGPDYRYTVAGGLNHVRENVHLYWHSPGAGPVSREAWETLIRQAQQSLMESPLHRDNILAPEHTHVGIGIAYNAAAGHLGIAQEFVDHYVTLQPLPPRASLGEAIVIQGRLEAGAVNPFINLAYEPFPAALTLAKLRTTGTYKSPAETYEVVPLSGDAGGRFSRSVILDNRGQAGLYHVRVWVETEFGQIMAADVIVGAR